MAHCFLSSCIVPVIMIFHVMVGGGDGADAGGGGGDGGSPCNCDFRNDMCCWKGLPLSTRAVWERPDGAMGHQESMTGQIVKDHTYQNDTKYYVHVSAQNEIAILQSSALKNSTIYCLRFWYYIEVGPGKGNLHVILVNYTTGDIKGAEAQSAWTAPSRTPSNTYWTGAQVDIYYKDVFRIFFLASHVNYTAIDDITLTEAPCTVRPTEKPSITLGTLSVAKYSVSHVLPSVYTNKPNASQRKGSKDFLAVRPTEKTSSTMGAISVAKSSASLGSPFVSTHTPETSQRNGSIYVSVRPTEKTSSTMGAIPVAKSSASLGSPFVSTHTPEASQRNGSIYVSVRPTEKTSSTMGAISVAKYSASLGSPFVSTHTPDASQRNGSTYVFAVRPTEKTSSTMGAISVAKSSASLGSPFVSTHTPEASQRNGSTYVFAVRPTEKTSSTMGAMSVAKSSASLGSPFVSTHTPEASQRNGSTYVFAVRPTEKTSSTMGAIPVAKSSASLGSPFVSTHTPEASQRNGSTNGFAEGLILDTSRTETTICVSEIKSTDGELFVTTRKSVSSKKPSHTVSITEIVYICIGVGCFLLLACFIGIFLCWKHRKKSQNGNDIELNASKTAHLPTSPYAAVPIKQNGEINHGFSTDLYARQQEMAVSHETGNGVQIGSESGKKRYQVKDFQGTQIDESVLTERKIGADKMDNESIFAKSKQSRNSSVALGSKGPKMQTKIFEKELESNTGKTVLTASSNVQKQTKPNSLTSCTVQENELNISNKRDEVSYTCTGRNDNDNLLKPLNPPAKESSRNKIRHEAIAILETQQKNKLGQPFNHMAVSPDKAYDASNSAKNMRVKYTSDHIF